MNHNRHILWNARQYIIDFMRKNGIKEFDAHRLWEKALARQVKPPSCYQSCLRNKHGAIHCVNWAAAVSFSIFPLQFNFKPISFSHFFSGESSVVVLIYLFIQISVWIYFLFISAAINHCVICWNEIEATATSIVCYHSLLKPLFNVWAAQLRVKILIRKIHGLKSGWCFGVVFFRLSSHLHWIWRLYALGLRSTSSSPPKCKSAEIWVWLTDAVNADKVGIKRNIRLAFFQFETARPW